MQQANILIVDDERLIRWSLKARLEQDGCIVTEAESGEKALSALESAPPDLVLLDFKLPDTDGLTLLKKIKQADPDILVIMMTGFSTIETAVEAMKQGAYHYLNKPVNLDELALLVAKALETTTLRREVKTLRASQSESFSLDRIIGESPPMKALKDLLRKIAQSPSSTVLVTGESGTGKDLVAKALHHNSSRALGPFMNITCSALPDTLLESELFGHERGAFTDARQQKKGLLEQADGGTVFLDEIGEMSPVLQAKLLRFLEDKAFRRVGGSHDIKPSVRVIAATNRELQDEVARGRFREDLFYRLNVLWVKLPPLRERGQDVALLAKHFCESFGREFRKPMRDISQAALDAMERYHWPGNVRELKNALERAVLLAESATLDLADFPQLGGVKSTVRQSFRLPDSGLNFEQLERELVEQALERCNGNQTKAATLLGMNRDQIRYRIEKFGLGKE
ncbi:MAG: Regulatory protein AtoC [Planctomycetes bacterium]|nr:Regulatory protein AtoC [Planctomycetota bacterium]HRJ77048.1 sigma-54 dependent transcriptional regulator [Planctomycetota bacterium]